jgi:hypothetical protein
LFTGKAAKVKPVDVSPALPEEPLQLPTVEPAPEPAPIIPVIESTSAEQFDWRPVGFVAMTTGAIAGAVGVAIYLKRVVRVRRLKFS